jgi:hypothetical protein
MSAMKEAFVLEHVEQRDYALGRRQPLVPAFAGMSADFAMRLIAINNNSAFVCPWVEVLRARGNTGSGCKIRGCRLTSETHWSKVRMLQLYTNEPPPLFVPAHYGP